jgi:putative DNA primase/helicase
VTVRDVLDRLPDARPCAGGWVACCPAHEDRHPSLSIRAGDNGHALLKCFAGCEYPNIIRVLRAGRLERAFDLSTGARRSALDEAARTMLARRIWGESRPAIGTLGERYLRSRGITMSIPATIRFHPALKHPSGIYSPVLLAAVQNREGAITGVHRTYLTCDGGGKADLEPQRAALGPIRGCAIRFARAGERLAIGEGIETCLSIAQACPDLAVWSAISAPNLPAIELPACVREVFIAADGDKVGERAAQAAGERFIKLGRSVRVMRPPTGWDFNDLLRRGAARG